VAPTALYALQRVNDFHCSHPAFFGNVDIMRRLLFEIVIIAAVIFLGWNTPFKDWTAQAYAKINSTFDSLGGNLQKNQDPSVKRY